MAIKRVDTRTIIDAKTIITVRRPDGLIEHVERKGTIVDPVMRRRMAEATRAAGRGEIIGWQVVERRVPAGCQFYSRDQGCPLHGELCR